jgi:hypothetical protein
MKPWLSGTRENHYNGEPFGGEVMSRSTSQMPKPFPPGSVWILGAGRFGRLAAERLSRRFKEADFLVIDKRADRLESVANDLGVRTANSDAIAHLAGRDFSDDLWIVPAVPVHAAFQWLLNGTELSSRAQPIPVPDAVDRQVPNPYRVPDGTVYASYATFLCPDACSEPEDRCTYTGEPRLGNLFDELTRISVSGFRVSVLRSWQLAPGVGGYIAGQLRQLLKGVLQSEGGHIIATCCRCHGVINALTWF